VFLDQDDVICAGYLAAMHRALNSHPMVGARIDHERLNPGWISSSRRPAQVQSLGNSLGFLPYAGGQTLGIRRDVFDAVGGFDPAMPGAVEDVDLCWRVQLAGWELTYVPDAVVHYRYRSTLRGQLRQAYAYGRAEATLYQRYRSAGMQRRRNGEALKSWLVWAKRLALARSKGDVAKIGWKLAHDLGMARACIQFRVFYP
jgi:GT2 family glycosyltransferase